jgi:hypothetical protein
MLVYYVKKNLATLFASSGTEFFGEPVYAHSVLDPEIGPFGLNKMCMQSKKCACSPKMCMQSKKCACSAKMGMQCKKCACIAKYACSPNSSTTTSTT